jgi:hypothetical protein
MKCKAKLEAESQGYEFECDTPCIFWLEEVRDSSDVRGKVELPEGFYICSLLIIEKKDVNEDKVLIETNRGLKWIPKTQMKLEVD